MTVAQRWVVSAAVVAIVSWGGALLLLLNALSGPFTVGRWVTMTAMWLGAPLAITGSLVSIGALLTKRGEKTWGWIFVALPLASLLLAAAWAWYFG